MGRPSSEQLKLGKIGYLNVLPVYYPLESGIIDHPFSIVSGPPAHLNRLTATGELDLSVVSSIEYARHPERYFILPDLSISCHGEVKSVLLLSRVPFADLAGRRVLVSSQSHTSVALLRILFSARFGMDVEFENGSCTEALTRSEPPTAFLVIGDEALRLRNHELYPHRTDLGEAWRAWTGLPFVFALWVARRKTMERRDGLFNAAATALISAKRWGRAHLDEICETAARSGILNAVELHDYYRAIGHDLNDGEIKGLRLFFKYLERIGEVNEAPALDFYSPLASVA